MKDKKGSSRFYRVCYAIFSRIVKLIFRIRVINPENEPDEGGFLICGNHIAASDPVILCYAFRKHQAMFMAKKELFKIPLLSGLIRMLGAFPIDRGGSDVGAIKRAVNMLGEGKCIGVFPQGHRYPGKDPRNTPTKNGAGFICARAHSDVVPVYIYRKNNTPRLFRRTYVIIGERIRYAELDGKMTAPNDYSSLTSEIFDRVCTLGENFVSEEKTDEGKT